MKAKFIYAFSIFLSIFFFTNRLTAQTYQYLKYRVLLSDNFKIQEIDWYAGGVSYPTVDMTSASSGGYVASGDGADWSVFLPYDGDPATHHWFGAITDPLLAEELILDLGSGNGIFPDSVVFTKPGYSTVQHFQIWASNDNQNWERFLDTTLASSGWSTQAFPLTLDVDNQAPTPPGNLMASYITSNSLSLFWEASTDNVEVVEYEVFQNGASIGTTTNTSFYIDGLSSGTGYDFKAVAKDFQGNTSDASTEITVYTNTEDSEAPSVPANLITASKTNELVNLSWDASADNIGVIGYIVYLHDVPVGTVDGTTFSLPGLKSSTSYSFTVKAKDAAGNISGGSAALSVTTAAGSNNKMRVGTNFWDVAWGGSSADPFKDSYDLVTGENPWKTALLDETSIYCGFRFMDWGKTNNATIDHWMDRKQKADINQRDVAYEWMIDFCNKTNSDIWICIPHPVITRDGYEKGDNHYVKKLAILLKTGVDMLDIDLDGAAFANLANMTRQDFIYAGGVARCEPLKSKLKIYIEYSNETWNFGFQQARYMNYEGDALGLESTPAGGAGENYGAGRKYHAWAALRVFEQMEDVLGTATPRLIKIDAYQAVNVSSIISNHFSIYQNATYNPRGIFPDGFSPAPYFGNGVDGSAGTAVADLNASIDSRIDALEGTRAFLDTKETELSRKFKLIAYEGGQHVTTNADVINTSTEMYNLYARYLDSCNVYLDEFWHYAHSGNFSSGGAWGAKSTIGEDMSTAHKYRAIVDFLGGAGPVAADVTPPSVPSNLASTTVTQTAVSLQWDASTDNDAVNGYQIYQNGFYIGYSTTTSYQVNGLSASTIYTFTIKATDESGNYSNESVSLPVTTMSATAYSITFTVTDGVNAIEGANVNFRSADMLTDNAGKVVFNNILSGTGLAYTITMDGYLDKTGTVDIVDSDVSEAVELTGVTSNNESLQGDVTVYPIPAQNTVVITSQLSIAEVFIFDITGKNVLTQEVDMQKELLLDISALESGVYSMLMHLEDGSMRNLKIVVK